MQQVLFTLPILTGFFPPDGIPIYGFGAMLFIAFILVTWWGTVRVKPIGMPAVRFQDFTFCVFVSGLVGARLLYMYQYSHKFTDRSPMGLIGSFFKIWEGGIIFYGSALGGAIGYSLFYRFVLRRMNVSGWQLADAVAPLLALGLAIGRIGCYLNGCCWGQVACDQCATIPLGAAHFPLLPAHARGQLVDADQFKLTDQVFAVLRSENVPEAVLAKLTPLKNQAFSREDSKGKLEKFLNANEMQQFASLILNQAAFEPYLQTSTGFAIQPRERGSHHDDPRALVTIVEPGSPADKAGLLPGDRIVKVNGKPNTILVDVVGSEEQVQAALNEMKAAGGRVKSTIPGRTQVEFDTLPAYIQGQDAALKAANEIKLDSAKDYLDELTPAFAWPRGKTSLALGVEREGKEIDLPTFTPATVGLYPTQLYETVSMVLLILLLLAYYPYRRHDGQLMVVLMIGYAIHRFINESLRIEPTVGLGLTLSQWGSVVIFMAAVLMEAYLWRVMPSRWKGVPPPGPAPATQPDTISPPSTPSPKQ